MRYGTPHLSEKGILVVCYDEPGEYCGVYGRKLGVSLAGVDSTQHTAKPLCAPLLALCPASLPCEGVLNRDLRFECKDLRQTVLKTINWYDTIQKQDWYHQGDLLTSQLTPGPGCHQSPSTITASSRPPASQPHHLHILMPLMISRRRMRSLGWAVVRVMLFAVGCVNQNKLRRRKPESK